MADESDRLDFDGAGDEPSEETSSAPDELVVDPKDHTLAFEPVAHRRRPWRWVRMTILFVLLASAAAWGWIGWGLAYFAKNIDEVPLVRAAEGPLKLRPKVPGGLDVPNRDKLVYDRIEAGAPAASPTAETLLPRPETPLPPPTATAEPAPPVIMTSPPVKAEGAPAIAKSKTPSPEEVIAAQPPSPAPKPPTVKAAKTAEVASAPSAGPTKPASAKGSYSIQLAAVRSEQAARSEWARLRGQHKTLLGNLTLNVVRADLGSKGTFFRLRAGAFPDQAAARAICGELTKKKVGCLVVRPGG